jgi:hypothetical protein
MDLPGFDSATLLAFARYHTRTTWQKVQHDLKQPIAPKNAPLEIIQYEATKPTVRPLLRSWLRTAHIQEVF